MAGKLLHVLPPRGAGPCRPDRAVTSGLDGVTEDVLITFRDCPHVFTIHTSELTPFSYLRLELGLRKGVFFHF